MTEPRLKRCPSCRGSVKRLFGTGAGIIFKGSGFYETDYRSESYKQAAHKEKNQTSTSSSDSSKKKSEKKKTVSKKKEKPVSV